MLGKVVGSDGGEAGMKWISKPFPKENIQKLIRNPTHENIVKIIPTKTPINGDAMRPEIPVTGWLFQWIVFAPNTAKTPMSSENEIRDGNMPMAINFKSEPAVRRFIVTDCFIIVMV
jgi:hypothetical protein